MLAEFQPSFERFVATSTGMADSDFSSVKVIELVNKHSLVSMCICFATLYLPLKIDINALQVTT